MDDTFSRRLYVCPTEKVSPQQELGTSGRFLVPLETDFDQRTEMAGLILKISDLYFSKRQNPKNLFFIRLQRLRRTSFEHRGRTAKHSLSN